MITPDRNSNGFRNRIAEHLAAPLNNQATTIDETEDERGAIRFAGNEEAVAPLTATAVEPTFPTGEKNKPPRTLDDVMLHFNNKEADLRRDHFPVSRLTVKVIGGQLVLMAGDQQLRLAGEGFRRFCQRLGPPSVYLETLVPGLQMTIFNFHLRTKSYADRKLTDATSCLISRDGAFLDLGRIDLCSLSSAAVVQAVREGIGEDASTLEVRGIGEDEGSFTLDLVSPRLTEEVRRGDAIRGGVRIAHCWNHGAATQITAFIYRVVCANGMEQRQCVGERTTQRSRTRRLPAGHANAQEMQVTQIRKLAAETWALLPPRLAAIARLKDQRIEVMANLEQFLRQAHVWTERLAKQLRAAWQEEGAEATTFGALNALTRVATHTEGLSVGQRTRLYRLAGVFANKDKHLCPRCLSMLAKGAALQ